MSADNDKLVQPIDSREPYVYGTSQDKIHKTGYENIIKQCQKWSAWWD